MPGSPRRVFAVAPLPPEKAAYALARYSRSPDSIASSIDWVRTHDSSKFLDSFYFQYGHASIADLGHVTFCFEGLSELAATEVEDEQLWDGQARSSRYQDFGKSGFITPEEFTSGDAATYRSAGEKLLEAYRLTHDSMSAYLQEKLPRPDDMKPDAYGRNIAARAFDIARYFLFWGIPTGVGQVTSIRTLERQIRRLKASEYEELRDLALEIARACTEPPSVFLDENSARDPIAPTLANYVDADEHPRQAKSDLAAWSADNLPKPAGLKVRDTELYEPRDAQSDIAATLLYAVTDRPYAELYEFAASQPALAREVIDVALKSRSRRDELMREFRGAPFVYDMIMDIGAYRDLHRHRRCQQTRQAYSTSLGYSVPAAVIDAGQEAAYRATMDATFSTVRALPCPGAQYLLPFATRGRFLFKMDFAETEYMSRLRSGVKGHFSYRQVAWEMKLRMDEVRPDLGRLIIATPPEVEDPLKR